MPLAQELHETSKIFDEKQREKIELKMEELTKLVRRQQEQMEKLQEALKERKEEKESRREQPREEVEGRMEAQERFWQAQVRSSGLLLLISLAFFFIPLTPFVIFR